MCRLGPDPLWFRSKTYMLSFPIHLTTQKHLSDPPARHQCPTRAVKPRKVGEIGFVSHLESKTEEMQHSAVLEAWGAMQAQGEALVAWLCTDTCCLSGCEHTPALPGRSGCDCLPSAVTQHFWNYSLACTLFTAHHFSLKNDVRVHKQDWVLLKLKEEDFYNITCTQAPTAAHGSSLVLGRSSLDKVVAQTLSDCLCDFIVDTCRHLKGFWLGEWSGLCSDLHSKIPSLNCHKKLQVAEIQNNALIQIFVYLFVCSCKAASWHLLQ